MYVVLYVGSVLCILLGWYNGGGGSIISVSPFCNPVLLFMCAAVQVTSGTTLQASKPGKFSSFIWFIVMHNAFNDEFFWYSKNGVFWDVTPCGSCKN
jgi:hypothetical protein